MKPDTNTAYYHTPTMVNKLPNLSGLMGLLWKHVELRDHVKVMLWSLKAQETVWLEVVMKSKDYWIGQCKSQLIFFGLIKVGDLVKFHPCNIYEISEHEEDDE